MPQNTTVENPAPSARGVAGEAANRVSEAASRAAEQAQRWNANRRKPIDTRMHGTLDYTLSPTLLLSPSAFGFPSHGAASAVPRAYGAASMIYSTLTRYDFGIQPILPMKTHLILDAVSSVFMAVSPWVLGFGRRSRPRTWAPHLAFAAAEMTIVALSDDRSTR